MMIESPVMIERVQTELTQPDFPLTMPNEFYQRMSFEQVDQTINQYQLEQEEIKRLEEEKKEKERLEKETKEKEVVPTFDPNNITTLSNLSSEHFYQLLGNTELLDVAWTFAYAEKHYGINALFLAGLTILESGWGASERSWREYNLTGYNIVSDHSSYSFESRSDSILATASLLATHYIPEDGMYHRGLSVWNINESYCAQPDWSNKILSIVNHLMDDLK